jgi:hypothetical protein
VSAAALFGAGHAAAQSTNRVAAEGLFREARKLLDEGKYKEACEKLAASERLDPAVGTLLNLGRCYEKTGQKASAWETYREAITAAKQTGQADREKAARRAADALEPNLPQLTISVAPEARLSGLQVTRDGLPVVSDLWGVTVPVDPGEHTIAATAPGMKDWSTTVTAEERATKTVTVPALERGESTVPPAAAPPTTTPASTTTTSTASTASLEDTGAASQPSYWNGQRTLAVVFGGVGIAGGVVAVVEALRFNDKKNQSDGVCPTGECKTKEQIAQTTSLRNEARDASTIGIVSGAVGGASLIAGVVLWFTAGSGSPQSSGKVQLTPVAGADIVGMQMSGKW